MTESNSILDELRWRGLLHQTAGTDIDQHLAAPGRVVYCGFDPTADSLTVGNLIAIKLLMHWQRAGHRPIVLMGGGTGLIGDPSGRDSERQLRDQNAIEASIDGQRPIFEKLLDFDGPNGAVILNNAQWLCELKFIDVLRDIGKYFSVNAMIQKDSVRERLTNREQGISYTEFSYMLMQAYDFLHLHRRYGCTVQTAGSDQYGNIVAGIDLIRRHESNQAYAVTAPLITDAEGKKIGKSVGAEVWLSAEQTSPYQFYQYWLNFDDRDVVPMLKRLTFLSREAIDQLDQAQQGTPHLRPAQKALASLMTEMVHGGAALAGVEHACQALFGGGDLHALSAQLLDEVFADVPHSVHSKTDLAQGLSLVDFLPCTSLAASKREAREFIGNGAIAVNGVKADSRTRLDTESLLHGETILLRRGKKRWHATQWQ